MNLRRLYEHLDHDARRVLHVTAEAAARDGRGSITIELFLVSLLRERDVGPAVMKALDGAGADAPAIESALAAQVAKDSRSASGALPSFDESLAHLLREAWSLAFDEYGESAVTPVRFFETIARRGDRWPRLVAMLPGFERVDLARLAAAGGPCAARDAAAAVPAGSRHPELSRYGSDMRAVARNEGFDPVVGLHAQMQAISTILLRRRQNSAIVVGESGVGKTAARSASSTPWHGRRTRCRGPCTAPRCGRSTSPRCGPERSCAAPSKSGSGRSSRRSRMQG